MSTNKLVTIGIPLYKRFEYVPHVLEIVASQDYPNIELLVSDNGMNGRAIPEMVDRHYRKPYRFRQNPSTVSISNHFSQLVREASGEYFIVLADDDEISSNYVSDLVSLLEKHPEASVALAVQESIDDDGNLIGRSKDTVPEILSGPEFIKAIWGTHMYMFRSLSTYMARRERLIACGCYPEFCVPQFDEDAMIMKACLDNFIVFSTRSTFRKRYSDTTDQGSMPIHLLAKVTKEFLNHIDTHPIILKFATAHPAEWEQSKRYLIEDAWRTYYFRWVDTYKKKMPRLKWMSAAFDLPFIPNYYRAVASTLAADSLSASVELFKRVSPQGYDFYRSVKAKFRKPPSTLQPTKK